MVAPGTPTPKDTFINIPRGNKVQVPSSSTLGGPKHSVPNQFGTSPNSTMASRLGSWFRNRAGSVPAKPSFSGRKRHRTQSEGEKQDEIEKLPENCQQ